MKSELLIGILIIVLVSGCLSQTSKLDKETVEVLKDRTSETIKREPVKIERISEGVFIAKYELSFFERLIRSVFKPDEPLLIGVIVRPHETIYVSSGDSQDEVMLSCQPVVEKYVEYRRKWVERSYELIEEKGSFKITVTPRRSLDYQEALGLVERYNLTSYSMRVYASGEAAQETAEGLWQEEVRMLKAQGDSSFPPERHGTESVSVSIEESGHDFVMRRNRVIIKAIRYHYPKAGVIQISARTNIQGLKGLMGDPLVLLPDPWVDEMEGYYKEEGFDKVSVWRPGLAVFLKIGR